MITEKELENIGFAKKTTVRNTPYYTMKSRFMKANKETYFGYLFSYDLKTFHFELELEDKKDERETLLRAEIDFKVNTLQDLKKVIKNLKELSEFMV